MRLSLSALHYPEHAQIVATYRELERRINEIPGVEAAGFSRDVPLAGDFQGTSLLIEGEPEPGPDENRSTHFSVVTPGYFEAMGIPVVSGRGFRDGDADAAAAPVLVNTENGIGVGLGLGLGLGVHRRLPTMLRRRVPVVALRAE